MATIRILIVLGSVAVGAMSSGAAEIEVRRECRSAGNVVTLGDVAVIHAPDVQEAAKLAATELFPSPPPGQQRFLRVRELQDLLLLRGVQLQRHRMTGNSQVAIHGAEGRTDAGLESVSPLVAKKAQREVSEAVIRCLQQAAGITENWSVAVQLDEQQARMVTMALGNVSARGGVAPWVGRQVFEVTAGSGAKTEQFTAQASVTLPLRVVVTTRSLQRGAVIGPTDVRMESGTSGESQGDCFHAVEEVIGSEMTQSIGEGEVLQKRVMRAPLLVHRGEIVSVYARTAGVYVRTTARVREDGSLGDLVSVESLTDRKAFLARVCGIRELEVFARAAQAESPVTAEAPVAVR